MGTLAKVSWNPCSYKIRHIYKYPMWAHVGMLTGAASLQCEYHAVLHSHTLLKIGNSFHELSRIAFNKYSLYLCTDLKTSDNPQQKRWDIKSKTSISNPPVGIPISLLNLSAAQRILGLQDLSHVLM